MSFFCDNGYVLGESETGVTGREAGNVSKESHMLLLNWLAGIAGTSIIIFIILYIIIRRRQ